MPKIVIIFTSLKIGYRRWIRTIKNGEVNNKEIVAELGWQSSIDGVNLSQINRAKLEDKGVAF